MSAALVKVNDLSISYATEEGALQALRHATLELRAGEAVGIVGESGCGKSTVARLLVGLYEPTRGSVSFDGQDAHAAFKSPDARQMRQRIHILLDQFLEPEHHPRPALRIGCGPARLRGLRGGQRHINDDLPQRSDARAVARPKHRGGTKFLDHGRTLDPCTNGQRAARVNRGAQPGACFVLRLPLA